MLIFIENFRMHEKYVCQKVSLVLILENLKSFYEVEKVDPLIGGDGLMILEVCLLESYKRNVVLPE